MLLFTSREREQEYEDLYLEIITCITYPIWLKVSLGTTLDSLSIRSIRCPFHKD
jgi:hypothetical protein